ncbi:MAG: trehalose-phosphatase [Alphaproteobacteria bacterium]|nr:trehalose-phosphatase [Alphaproteobacteria bacterium]
MDDRLPLPTPDALWAFFLDVDGTLGDIAPTPSAVVIADHVPDTLTRLAALSGGAVALVSGRTITEVDRLFAPLHLPVAGLHGLERRNAADRISRPVTNPAPLESTRHALQDFASAHPGTLVEDKGISIALHFRGAAGAEKEAEGLVTALLARHGAALELQRGKMVLELRPRGADKGTAIRAFMAEPPFAGRIPVFVGDDVTDEAGFATINDLDGISIRVGDGTDTCARYVGASVAAIHRWLDDAARTLAGHAQGTKETGHE